MYMYRKCMYVMVEILSENSNCEIIMRNRFYSCTSLFWAVYTNI